VVWRPGGLSLGWRGTPVPAEEFYQMLSKSDARKVRKGLHKAGRLAEAAAYTPRKGGGK
jgi:hypothetical protein